MKSKITTFSKAHGTSCSHKQDSRNIFHTEIFQYGQLVCYWSHPSWVTIYQRDQRDDQRDDYKTACLLDYWYFKENYNLIVIDFRKQEEFYTDTYRLHWKSRLSRKSINVFYYWRKETFFTTSTKSITNLM